MNATITDRRPELWIRRRHITEILAQQRRARALICGCASCGDDAAGKQLDALIRKNVDRLDGISDLICERNQP
jgi:hypothetical protein